MKIPIACSVLVLSFALALTSPNANLSPWLNLDKSSFVTSETTKISIYLLSQA